jgi:hypothetical protein
MDNEKLAQIIEGNSIQWNGNNREEIEIFCQIKKFQAYDYQDAQKEAKQISFVNGEYLWIKNNEAEIKASYGQYISYNEERQKFEVKI